MSIAQLSKVKVFKEPGANKIKHIQFEGFPDHVRMGVHGGIAQFFKLDPDDPQPSTIDYLVAAIGGCLTGTVAGALEARGVSGGPENLETNVEGQIENVDGKLLLTNVTVKYKIKIPADKRASFDRAMEQHDNMCPVSASLKRGIKVEWKAEIEEA